VDSFAGKRVVSEQEQRQRVVAVAKTYLGTPYHSHARVKGAGVDCLTLLSCVWEESGLIPRVKLPHYSEDYFKHKGGELYLKGLLDYTVEIETPPEPGDIVLWKFGRCFSHGAIVIDWPHIIHAQINRHVTIESAEAAQGLKFIGENVPGKGGLRPRKTFSYWRKQNGGNIRGKE